MKGFGFLIWPLDVINILLMHADSAIMKVEFWWKRRKSRRYREEWKRKYRGTTKNVNTRRVV